MGEGDKHDVVLAQPLHRGLGADEDVKEDVAEAGGGPHDQLEPLVLGHLEVDVAQAPLHVGVILLVKQLALFGVQSVLFNYRLRRLRWLL